MVHVQIQEQRLLNAAAALEEERASGPPARLALCLRPGARSCSLGSAACRAGWDSVTAGEGGTGRATRAGGCGLLLNGARSF